MNEEISYLSLHLHPLCLNCVTGALVTIPPTICTVKKIAKIILNMEQFPIAYEGIAKA